MGNGFFASLRMTYKSTGYLHFTVILSKAKDPFPL